ncbi:MAG: ATP-binding cassette domain-containing protein [Myxococcota bacterium]|nr:ATP-binding cassette domain-containing protein [Myxococcota bacterium]
MALQVDELRVELGRRIVLGGVDLTIAVGERVALMGTSGSGKTTLVRAIAGLQQAIAGTVTLGERKVSDGGRSLVTPSRRGISLVFQDLALWPHMTAVQHLRFVLGGRTRSRAQTDAQAHAALDDVGLGDRAGSRPAELSGGERQRLALARALAPRPGLLLLDEPFGSLDLPLKLEMTELLRQRQRDGGFTLLHVTHDPLDALRTASRVVLLERGTIQFDGPASELTGDRTPALAPLCAALRQTLASLNQTS